MLPCVRQGHTGRGSSGSLYLKSAVAGVISVFEGVSRLVCVARNCVEGWVLRNSIPRIMSGGEPSSIKRIIGCAAGVPGWSSFGGERGSEIIRSYGVWSYRTHGACYSAGNATVISPAAPLLFYECEVSACIAHCIANTVPVTLKTYSVRNRSRISFNTR